MAAQAGAGEDPPTALPPTAPKDKKATEPLFGPSIGTISGGPAWTFSNEKKVVSDELTPEIVNGWIEKSKQVCIYFLGLPVPCHHHEETSLFLLVVGRL